MLPDHPDGDRASEPVVSPELDQDEQQAAGILDRLKLRVHGTRSWVHRRPGGERAWRIGIALLGLVVIIVGVALLVLPGPGWVVIFVGLGIWATEFAWARALLSSVQHAVAKWTEWIRRQPRWLALLAAAVGLIVIAAIAVGVRLLAVD